MPDVAAAGPVAYWWCCPSTTVAYYETRVTVCLRTATLNEFVRPLCEVYDLLPTWSSCQSAGPL